MDSPCRFDVGDAYKRLHKIATSQKLEVDLSGDKELLAVGILSHTRDPLSCVPNDFTFFKINGKHTIKKLRVAYQQRAAADRVISLRYADSPTTDDLKLRKLNHMGDSVVILTAHEENGLTAPSPNSSAQTPTRNPLSPVNTQLRAIPRPRPEVKPIVKNEYQLMTIHNDCHRLSSTVSSSNTRHELVATPSQILNDNIEAESNSGTPTNNKGEDDLAPESGDGAGTNDTALAEAVTNDQPSCNDRLSRLIQEASPDMLEAEVHSNQSFLENLKKPMLAVTAQHRDASHWVQQIERLQKQKVDTPTIIGVVGNTGAGKSSVINAMLEEERLVPTNCMRACTAVVTEMSWNPSNDPKKKFRAEIHFIQAEDWRKDIEISLSELVDGNGQLSRECTNPESEAGVAYAKLRAVYPQKTREMLANTSVDALMEESELQTVLGKVRNVEKGNVEYFYKALQSYIDSQEKSTTAEPKKRKKGEKKPMEFWPLIKVVKLFVKADALSTGAVIVDLPGVHDSNAARAAVAQGYMKQCTGLFVVAPINRAVDDKAAKDLLGDAFKRQLKFDGIYSRITFICSKTDDISVMEASTSLGLEEDISEDWDQIDEHEKKEREMRQAIKDLKEAKAVYTAIMNDTEDEIEVWDKLKDDLDEGREVFAPREHSQKRKRSSSPEGSKKRPRNKYSDIEEIESIDDSEDDSTSESDSKSFDEPGCRVLLDMETIESKISQLKADKKRARKEKNDIDVQLKVLREELDTAEQSRISIETTVRAVCIEGRNKYSKGAIQRDFADGIRELDQEAAQEENPDQFDPDQDLRDYDVVARSLPVFCVSSRAYQKLQGRFVRDADVPGFRSCEETEIPQLQQHCKRLTEAGRASNYRGFLTDIAQLLNSLTLWASNDGTGVNMTDAQLADETRFLKNRLDTLEKSLEKAVKDCLKDMNVALAENIFDHYEHLVEQAIQKADSTVEKWHRPYQRDDRANSGYHFSTYKAIMRRDGVYRNFIGEHDFNANLIEPIMIALARHWEKVFAQRIPRVLQSFTRDSKKLLTTFHKDIEVRCVKAGTGASGIAVLSQQLKTYDGIFAALAQQMTEVINQIQREANREFTPVIARALSLAYGACAAEHGSGCYKRMKTIMSEHVHESRLTMFADSCEEVKLKLISMSQGVEEQMGIRTDEVFTRMQRDYMEVVAGTKFPLGQMPKWERRMRSDVYRMIEDRILTADDDAKKAGEALMAAKRALVAASDDLDDNDMSDADLENGDTSVDTSGTSDKQEGTGPSEEPSAVDATNCWHPVNEQALPDAFSAD